MAQSLIYRNIFFYRFVMNLIYAGKYKRRFKRICKLLLDNKTNSVCELCFGDTYIAEFCKKNDIQWTGYDLNKMFVEHALKLNYNAINIDVTQLSEFVQCDTYIMIGSLYHFKEDGFEIIRKMINNSSKTVIISEPVRNFSSKKGLIGYIARRSANVGKKNESFRYNEKSIIQLMDKLNVNYNMISIDRDILIEIYNG